MKVNGKGEISKGLGNNISESVSIEIGDNSKFVIGDYNTFGENTTIIVPDNCTVLIGDCNRIGSNIKFLIGSTGISIGDWNVLHDNMLIMGGKGLNIGHNCWFGQNTILDGSGKLLIGNGVRVGMYSQLWTHVASGEQIEGCILFGDSATVLQDDVWLVGSCFVGSGLNLARKTICLAGSNVTKNTEENGVYGGAPAKKLEKLNFWKEVDLTEKMEMLKVWLQEDSLLNQNKISYEIINIKDMEYIRLRMGKDSVIFGVEPERYFKKGSSNFCIKKKVYDKTKSELERLVFRHLYNNRARFLPLSESKQKYCD